jgi:hypothetical protein
MRLLAPSNVKLLAIKISVFRYRIDGNERCRQSGAEPLRTTSALVNAAKLIEIPKRITQMPVEAAAE